jgi:nucleoside-diphosphate-sugar epimerase
MREETMMTERHVVLGASGGTGSAVVRALAEAGAQVRAVNRRGDAPVPDGVERLAADVSTIEGARSAVAGAGVVYHCAQPEYVRWAQDFPGLNRTIANAAEAEGAKLVFADNVYMYDPAAGPISESSPPMSTTTLGRLRQEMADELLERHRQGRLRVAIGRSSDYYGPFGTGTFLGDRLFEAILAGRKAQWMSSLDIPHTCSYLPDMGRALVTLGRRSEADGRAWILPAAEPLTGAAFIERAGRIAGTTPKAGVITPTMTRIAGLFVPLLRSYREMTYQWTTPFVLDASAFQETFGPFEVTAHDDALAATIDWFRAEAAETAA